VEGGIFRQHSSFIFLIGKLNIFVLFCKWWNEAFTDDHIVMKLFGVSILLKAAFQQIEWWLFMRQTHLEMRGLLRFVLTGRR
jgi:hypothetical protein